MQFKVELDLRVDQDLAESYPNMQWKEHLSAIMEVRLPASPWIDEIRIRDIEEVTKHDNQGT